jgi:hypothetical protein
LRSHLCIVELIDLVSFWPLALGFCIWIWHKLRLCGPDSA